VTYSVAYDEHGVSHEVRSVSGPLEGRMSVSTACRMEHRECGAVALLARKGIVTCIECMVIELEESDG